VGPKELLGVELGELEASVTAALHLGEMGDPNLRM
jgi:hypothetical protein